jgi:hypothetical protein
LAEDAVCCELLSDTNTLFNGKIQGIFEFSSSKMPDAPINRSDFCALEEQFPERANREYFRVISGNFRITTGNLDYRVAKPIVNAVRSGVTGGMDLTNHMFRNGIITRREI